MNVFKIIALFLCFNALVTSYHAHANLLISPTRIAFDERQRVAQVIVINNSNEYKTYRLAWEEKKAKPVGGYTRLEPETPNPTSLSNMVRMSPSQVRLAPGERQIVKLALRKPQNLAEQEYRSHLLFQALPNETKSQSENQGMGININLILSYSIPVILRQGTKLPEVDIQNVSLNNNGAKKILNISIARKGKYSSFGKIEVLYKAKNSKEEVTVAMVNDYSIYPEIALSKLALNIFDHVAIDSPGQLRIVYSGLKEYRGQVFAEKVVNIDASSIGLLN
ncbi:fimbria/pilus periplasmic chaperone [Pseudoalteromonas tetraodonis]|uniref:fimbrial biogenesis chaperone n=1 Tax=Pseudoalteromonas tetraodonis TaxID=43659 RepID=UPI001BDF4289|nr:fimbria/pilus periplasmic chaperone [Pseudoalteromonas tetraodonis]MBT2151930.1 fimbria/pilus periplasmic chaperone [Pseudoalteromonas tetraodonis]MDX1726699.1 fimbria/pilus periplasmic chaperone [Pseudoalteromonas tetraodonis]